MYHRLRDIFVLERRSSESADGPADHQAAVVMGNSVDAWDAFYDKVYTQREGQAAVDVMGQWRAQLLEKETASLPTPIVAEDEHDVIIVLD